MFCSLLAVEERGLAVASQHARMRWTGEWAATLETSGGSGHRRSCWALSGSDREGRAGMGRKGREKEPI